MSWPRRTGSSGDKDENGFSLVEVSFTSAISLLVFAIAFSLVISLTRADVRGQAVANNQEDVRLAMGQMTRELRSSNPFDPAEVNGTRLTPTPSSLRLAAGPSGPGQTFVEWKFDATAHQLLRSVLATATGSATTTAVVLRNLTPPNGVVFQYFCLSGAPLDPASPSANGDLPAFTYRVHITLAGATNPGPAPFNVQEDVQLRNMSAPTC